MEYPCLSIFENKRCDDDMRSPRIKIVKSIVARYNTYETMESHFD